MLDDLRMGDVYSELCKECRIGWAEGGIKERWSAPGDEREREGRKESF
jgi:hypothetical protein